MVFVMFSTQGFFPRAAVAASSIKLHHPQDRLDLVTIPDKELVNGYIPNMPRMRLERCLEHLRAGETVISVGADCVFYAPLQDFIAPPYEEANIVLTPHTVKPPADAAAQYRCGAANADLVGFSPTQATIEAVEWLLKQPLALGPGQFYEQTPMSMLPFIMRGVEVSRDSSINVAYFNLHERELKKNFLGNYLVDNNPLTMFQFSGWCPETLSKHWINPVITPTLKELMSAYQSEIEAFRPDQNQIAAYTAPPS